MFQQITAGKYLRYYFFYFHVRKEILSWLINIHIHNNFGQGQRPNPELQRAIVLIR